MACSPRSTSTDFDSTANDNNKLHRPESSSIAQGLGVLSMDSGQSLPCTDSVPAENNKSDDASRLPTPKTAHHDPCDHLRSRLLVNVTFPDVTWTAPPTEVTGTLAFFRAHGVNGNNVVVNSNRVSDPRDSGHGASSCWGGMASEGTANDQRRPQLNIAKKDDGACSDDGRARYLRATGGEGRCNTERREAWVRLEEFIKTTAALEVGPRPKVRDIWTPAGSISERLFRGVPEVRIVLRFSAGNGVTVLKRRAWKCACEGVYVLGKHAYPCILL